ncbi:hypothetical protein BH11MYX2_BH11MYX2_41460 [soil metagenome]
MTERPPVLSAPLRAIFATVNITARMPPPPFRVVLGYVGVVMILAWLVMHATGCFLFERAPAAVSVAEYMLALDVCREEGKIARSYAVYEACAKEADKRYGLKDGAR